MILAVIFGWLLFKWVNSIYGSRTALLTLFLYAFSPTFLAHSRYVTTDLAAAFGFFIGIVAFLRFLEKQTLRRLLVAGIAFGVAQLLKFSLFLLVPIYGIFSLLWVFLQIREEGYEVGRREKIKSFFKGLGALSMKLVLIGVIGLVLIQLLYIWHVWNYPQERQFRDAEFILSSFGIRAFVNLDLWLIKNEILRPLGQYLLGLLMVVQRAAGGNTTYYLGEVSAAGWFSYFPVAYLLKETVAFHLLTLLAIGIALRNVIRAKEKSFNALLGWTKDNFVLGASFIFILFYWAYSIKSPLNIGVRHVLPTFPFIYLLVSRELMLWLYRPSLEETRNIVEWLKLFYRKFLEPIPKVILVSSLLLWIVLSAIITFPFYLSYYNEFIGIENGYYYIVDSNYDWGQDLKRLRDLLERDSSFKGQKIYLDYFGGGSPRYYLGEKFEPWNSVKGAPPSGSYFAVSTTILRGAQGMAAKGFYIKPEDSYEWLQGLEPVRRGGLSIFVYKIP
jgi:hypothetical protein